MCEVMHSCHMIRRNPIFNYWILFLEHCGNCWYREEKKDREGQRERERERGKGEGEGEGKGEGEGEGNRQLDSCPGRSSEKAAASCEVYSIFTTRGDGEGYPVYEGVCECVCVSVSVCVYC